jgi:hypothetical protein
MRIERTAFRGVRISMIEDWRSATQGARRDKRCCDLKTAMALTRVQADRTSDTRSMNIGTCDVMFEGATPKPRN